MRRRLAREAVLQALYLSDVSGMSAGEAFRGLSDGHELNLDEKTSIFCKELLTGAAGRLTALDKAIEETSDNWELKRMAAVDRSILRLAAYELIHRPETPAAVVINEAIEIARKFSGEDSTRFINGILDKIRLKRLLT